MFAGQPIVGGKPQPIKVPEGLTDDPHHGGPSTVAYEKKRADAEARKKLQRKKRRSGGKVSKNKDSEGAKEYIMRKKELYRQRGKDGVPRDSKSVALPRLSLSLHTLIEVRPRPQIHCPVSQAAVLDPPAFALCVCVGSSLRVWLFVLFLLRNASSFLLCPMELALDSRSKLKREEH